MNTDLRNMPVHDTIVDILNELDFECCFNYSGRYMYGKKCFGFFCPYSPLEALHDFLAACVQSKCKDLDLIFELTSGPKWDDMGKSYIIYFPDLQIEDTRN